MAPIGEQAAHENHEHCRRKAEYGEAGAIIGRIPPP
jgi:hypothetical protein